MSQPTHFDQARVDEILAEVWARPRDPRSEAYKSGARAIVQCRLLGTPWQCPYPAAPAESDAWHAGAQEGHSIVRIALNPEAA